MQRGGDATGGGHLAGQASAGRVRGGPERAPPAEPVEQRCPRQLGQQAEAELGPVAEQRRQPHTDAGHRRLQVGEPIDQLGAAAVPAELAVDDGRAGARSGVALVAQHAAVPAPVVAGLDPPAVAGPVLAERLGQHGSHHRGIGGRYQRRQVAVDREGVHHHREVGQERGGADQTRDLVPPVERRRRAAGATRSGRRPGPPSPADGRGPAGAGSARSRGLAPSGRSGSGSPHRPGTSPCPVRRTPRRARRRRSRTAPTAAAPPSRRRRSRRRCPAARVAAPGWPAGRCPTVEAVRRDRRAPSPRAGCS